MLLRGQGPPTRVSFRNPAPTAAAAPAYKDRSVHPLHQFAPQNNLERKP
jgi:hypothetical protein